MKAIKVLDEFSPPVFVTDSAPNSLSDFGLIDHCKHLWELNHAAMRLLLWRDPSLLFPPTLYLLPPAGNRRTSRFPIWYEPAKIL